ncbi:MAG: zinc-ribbon domain-containing protein [Candidatus Methanoperedenaceae archaeon]|nr:zinc-ribbon domain-containing protein [Candidatus Methanoperedenaceae archaeon]
MEEYYCKKCGQEVGSNNQFCSYCGTSSYVKKKEIIFKCRVCNADFNEQIKLEKHINMHPKCKICGNLIDNIDNHLKLRHPKCEYCQIRFIDEHEFDEHFISIHLCTICGQKFKDLEERDNHYSLHPICNICNKRVNVIEEHLEYYHPKCEFCEIRFNEFDFKEHINSIHLCTICDQKFKTIEERDLHFDSHPICNLCNERVNIIEEHLEYYHPKCEFCQISFVNQSELNKHLKSIHSCLFCNQKFKTLEEKNDHLLSHPKCNICGITLLTNEKYEPHLLSHPKCQFCDEQFRNKQAKLNHIKEVHLCEACGQNFKTFTERDIHLNSHPKCELCGKYVKVLREHMFNHPLCNFCGERFNSISEFKKHLRKFKTHIKDNYYFSINIFYINGKYYFNQFFDDKKIFNELHPYYDKTNRHFIIKTKNQMNKVLKILDRYNYDTKLINYHLDYTLEIGSKPHDFDLLLKHTVYSYMRGNKITLVMKDMKWVNKAKELGAIPVRDL